MKKRNVLNSPQIKEFRKKKKRVLRNKIIFFLVLLILVFIGLSFISRWQKMNINNIEVSGNKVIDTDQIEKIVQADISGYYFWLFPKTNFVLYPKNKIEKDLSDNFKRFLNVSITLKGVKTIQINVTEREGKYLWCGITAPILNEISSEDKCYFMDDDGYIFDEAPYFSGGVYFKFYGQNDGNLSGSYFLKNYWNNLISFKNNLNQLELKPTNFWLDENGDGNISLNSMPMTGPKIIFKMDSDFDKLTENLQTAITTDPLQSDLKNKFNSLLYIDLRFGNKIYYKFK